MALLTLLVGLALSAVGIVFAAPFGPLDDPAISDPMVPFAPTLFVLGVMLVFFSAVVYEIYPGKD
jgi:hypothetical protein